MARLSSAQDLGAPLAEGQLDGDVVAALFWNWQLLKSLVPGDTDNSPRLASSTPDEVKHAAGQATMEETKSGGMATTRIAALQ